VEFIHFDSERLDVRSKDGPMARCSPLGGKDGSRLLGLAIWTALQS
jgi:hypothetical protein